MNKLEKQKDPLKKIAKELCEESWLLCFDEFQVSDIADAMILGKLFEYLFEEGAVVIATSNRHPDDLYKHGLQRESFLPFIKMFKEKLEVVELGSSTDYRLRHIKQLSTTYFTPLGEKADKFIKESFTELTAGGRSEKITLRVQGREVEVKKSYGDVAQFSFSELCEQPLGAADYIEIAREFSTIIIFDIPKLSKEKRNEAKRFVTLIDQLYEHKVKLICSAEVKADKLYKKGDGSFEFERTSSRLIEMQSDEYLREAHVA